MSFPQYAAYEDSGIGWLGAVPAHWHVTKTKHLAKFYTGWTPPTGDADAFVGDNFWANISDLGPKWIRETAKTISNAAAESSRIRMSPRGSLLFSFKLSIGQVSFAGEDMYTNEAIATFPPQDGFDLSYAYYAFPIFLVQNASENIYGAKLLNQELIRSAPLVLPTPEEQSAIAQFLDLETAKIDALIAEQQHLTALLTEKRQAVISHVVTKGLNPDVPMKDSGVEWLGEVPAHWGVVKLIELTANERHSFVNGPFGSDLLTSELVEQGVPVIYIRDIKKDGYSRNSEWCVTEEKAQQLRFCNVIPGDVLVAKVGDPPGLAAVYPGGEPEGIVTQDVIRLRLDPVKALPEYIRWLLNSKYGQTQIDSISVDSTRTRVGLRDYKQLRFFIPSIDEQSSIADHLEREVGEVDALAERAARAIALLRERRTALISAAVTGKIDVRGLADTRTTSPEARDVEPA